MRWAFVVLVGLVCFAAGVGVGFNARPTTAPAPAAEQTALTVVAEDAAVDRDAGYDTGPAGPRWENADIADEMRGTTTHITCLRATSELRLPFPYQDAEVRLCIREAENTSGADVFVETTAQPICGYSGCTVAVRFDEDPVDDMRADESTNHHSVFLRAPVPFIRRALTAHRFVIEIEFYNAGRRQVAFDGADGLAWELPAASRR